MAWIESHQEIGRHPKTKKLARRLGVSIPTAVGHLHLLWHWAMDFAEGGALDGFESWEIADAVMWEGDPDDLIDALITVGFIDRTDTGSSLHDWDDYTGRLRDSRDRYKEANRERQRRFRERHRNDGVTPSNNGSNVTVTLRNGPTVPNHTVPNQEDPPNPPAGGTAPPDDPDETDDVSYSPEFESFLRAYPKRIGKGAAWKAWQRLKPSKALQTRMIASVEAQKTWPQWQRENGKFIPNPATWINQARWDDEPPQAANNVRRFVV